MTIDKLLNFLGGIVLCLAVSLFLPPVIGLAVAITAAIAKEAYDSLGFGTPDVMDAVATVAGGLVGFLLIMISEAL